MTARSVSRIALVALATALTALFAYLAGDVAAGATPSAVAPWAPALGLELALRLDGLSIVLALIVSGIGALVAAYAASYVTEHVGRFYLHLTTFMLAMLGLVLADDLLLLYVFWELTSITSFFLIGFHHERAEARAAARHTLLVTVLGGLALFAGVILLRIAGGSSRISILLERGDAIRDHALYLPILLLVGVAAFTKSAQVPFHSWLPRAMEAPTPASAYLHAATMVKAGVYLLARLSPILAGTFAWTALVVPVGLLTMVLGAARALGESQLKRILAYSTVSALGLLTAMLGVGTTEAVVAALAYLLAHALYKGALFLAAGAIERGAGVKDVTALGGLLRLMPRVGLGLAIAALSMAGVPPLLGFLGKDLVYAGLWAAGPSTAWAAWAAWVPLGAAFASSALFVAIALELAYRPLRGPSSPVGARDPSAWLWAPPLALALAGLLAGLWPGSVAPLLARAASDVAPSPADPGMFALHGVSREVVLSFVTLAVGLVLFVVRAPLRRAGSVVARTLRLRPAAGYEWTMRGLTAVAAWQTRVLQNGYLRVYVLTTIGATAALMMVGLVAGGEPDAARTVSDLRFVDVGLTGVVLGAALVAVMVESRFAAIAAMGVVGFGVALVFLELGAPDLALTQFVVDVLLVVVFVLAFYHAPRVARLSSMRTRMRDAVVAGGFGLLMGALVLVAADTEPTDRVSDWALRESLPSGHGRNVVNVILTDFRSIDTLGEIAVLATAAFGVVALLRLRRREA